MKIRRSIWMLCFVVVKVKAMLQKANITVQSLAKEFLVFVTLTQLSKDLSPRLLVKDAFKGSMTR